MARLTAITGAPTPAGPQRDERWQAPTGRWLEPGKTFTVDGRRGKFRFRAYVHAAEPYIEAVDAKSKIRCLRPEAVRTVSNKIAEAR